MLYIQDINSKDLNKNKSILKAFLNSFEEIWEKHTKTENLEFHGFANIPMHRTFAFYITRLLFNNIYDQTSKYASKMAD